MTYNVYRGTGSNGETLLASGRVGTSYVDTTVTNGTTYYYKVTGVNQSGEGALSNEVNATPTASVPPASPSNLLAAGGSQRVTLSWTNNTTSATSISIERKQNPNQPFAQIATVAPTSTGYIDVGVRKKTTYYYRIRAVNGTLVSQYSNTASATTLP